MAYADVSKPVIIQASKTLSAKVDYFMRRMCIVSEGGSSLQVGSWKEITSFDVEDILSKQSGNKTAADELKRKLNGFFAFAGDKNVMVVEVGKFDASTNTISNQVAYLDSYILNAGLKSYCHYVPSSWYWPNERQVQIPNSSIEVAQSLYALRLPKPEGQVLPGGGVTEPISSVEVDVTTNIPNEQLQVTINPTNIATFDKETFTLTAKAIGEATITMSGKIDPLKGGTALVTFKVKVGAWNQNLTLTSQEQVQTTTPVEDTTTNGLENGGRDLAFVNLADKYTSMTEKTYFFIEMDKTQGDPGASEAFQVYKEKKSVFCIFDNLVDTSSYPLASCILGICASSRFDLSATQSGTPLNFKALSGQNFKPLKRSQETSLIQAPANYAGDLAGNCVVMNGRYTDGTAWEYYYQWDYLEFEIALKLKMLLLNGVNSSSSVIGYNQTGIDILKANIKSVLLLWQQRGVVTSFAKSLDLTTNQLTGVGDINAINFDTYIANNPEDYKNEIYKGFSFYVMIGRYPRQIFIEATLN